MSTVSWRTRNTGRALFVESLFARFMVELQKPCWWRKALGLLFEYLL